MKIQYMLNDDESSYVQVIIDQIAKTASITLVELGLEIQSNSISIAAVLETEPSINPQVHIAKKGRVWDFHIWKVDAHGEETRNTVGMLTENELEAKRVKFINEDPTDLTLKDYATQPLDVYHSVLSVNEYTFDSLNGITGQSGNGRTNVVLSNGRMELGFQSEVFIPMLSGSTMNLADFPFTLFIELDSIGTNVNTDMENFNFRLGNNIFSFDNNDGVTFTNGALSEVLFGADTFNQGTKVTIALHVGDTVELFVNGKRVAVNGFNRGQAINLLVMKSYADVDSFPLVNYIITHATTPYKLDSKPPALVLGIVAEPSNEEVLLKWEPNKDKDLKGYNVYVNGVRHNIAIITDSTYRVMHLENEKSYIFTVTAIDTANNESATSARVMAMPSDIYDNEAPLAPQDVVALGGDKIVNVTWKRNTEADLAGYNVYVNGVQDNVDLIKEEKYRIVNLLNGTQVEVTVTAVDTHGNESGYALSDMVTPFDEQAPDDVSGLKETHTSTTVSLSWTNPIDADFSYVNVNCNGERLAQVEVGYYDHKDLTPDLYEYTLSTVDEGGNESMGRTITVTIT